VPFDDPLVAGTELIRDAIRTRNYVPGVSGWTINADGTAEFHGITVTFAGGTIYIDSTGVWVKDPDGSWIHMFDEDPGTGAVIDVKPADVAGIVTTPGRIVGAVDPVFNTPSIEMISPQHDAEETSSLYLAGGSAVSPGSSIWMRGNTFDVRLDNDPTLPAYTAYITTNNSGRLSMSSTDAIDISAPDLGIGGDAGDRIVSEAPMYASIGGIVEYWTKVQDANLLNGWTNRGAGYACFAYRLLVSPARSLQIVGHITGGLWAGGTPVFNFDADYRPFSIVAFPVGGATASSTTDTPTMRLMPNGDLEAWNMVGGYAEICMTIPLDAEQP
jgi:hypothetical protein